METLSDMKLRVAIIRAAASLQNMVNEMQKKHLELKRMTKTATILLKTGFSSPGLFASLEKKCVETQHRDGGWVAIVDTMWNIAFLSQIDSQKYAANISAGKEYLLKNVGPNGIWGRSVRDFERIPVSGTLLFLLPDMATEDRLLALEKLWISEKNSLTYKASYTLMAFKRNHYVPQQAHLVSETMAWLINNQRCDGSFAPWKEHPVASDTYCTAIALLGMLSYPKFADSTIVEKAATWLIETQLPEGIWPYHEIEDGGGWALFALSCMKNRGGN